MITSLSFSQKSDIIEYEYAKIRLICSYYTKCRERKQVAFGIFMLFFDHLHETVTFAFYNIDIPKSSEVCI